MDDDNPESDMEAIIRIADEILASQDATKSSAADPAAAPSTSTAESGRVFAVGSFKSGLFGVSMVFFWYPYEELASTGIGYRSLLDGTKFKKIGPNDLCVIYATMLVDFFAGCKSSLSMTFSFSSSGALTRTVGGIFKCG